MATIINSIISPRYGTYGRNQTLVQTASDTIPMTNVTTWVSSTTATNMLASADKFTFVADLANYEYIVEILSWVQFYYVSGTAKAKGMPVTQSQIVAFPIVRTYSSANLLTGTTKDYNSVRNIMITPCTWQVVYSSATVMTSQANNGYGIYFSNTAPTASSTSSSSPTITVKRPQLNGRCNSTYFATSFASAVDKSKTKWNVTYNVYRVDKGSNLGSYMLNDVQVDLMRDNYNPNFIG